MSQPIYLDYAATTPLDKRVLAAMLPYLEESYANPASLHGYGQRARAAVENAREQVAQALNAKPSEIIFTSGATEADNQVLKSAYDQHSEGHIISSVLEHAAVLSTCHHIADQGADVTLLTPNAQGEITPGAFEAALTPRTTWAALMLVNNETGIITDISRISQLAHQAGARLFCDAVQAFGSLPVDVQVLGVDMLAISAHKLYGPKGVGALYVREEQEVTPLLLGGSQERGRRAGTLNVPAIVGLGQAAELAVKEYVSQAAQIAALRNQLEALLLTVEDVHLNGKGAPRGPKHLSIRVGGVDGEALLMGLDQQGVMVSAGSACAAGSLEPSHVLTAMGLSRDEARASLRFSVGKDVTPAMLTATADIFKEVVARCRLFAAL